MKIFDCFTFFNELELLELRLAELYNHVDYFILVEASRTHTGNSKDFIFATNYTRYAQWLDKIIYIQVEDLPIANAEQRWVAENFQRNAIARGLQGRVQTGDKVMVSDVDEIPSITAIDSNLNNPNWIVFKQSLFYYYVNCKVARNWGGTIMASYGTFDTPQRLRNSTRRNSYGVHPNGGWHYSYLVGCDPERLRYKTQNIVDYYNNYLVGDNNTIVAKIKNQKDVYGRKRRGMQMQIVDITNDQPSAMSAWLIKYPHLYYRETT